MMPFSMKNKTIRKTLLVKNEKLNNLKAKYQII